MCCVPHCTSKARYWICSAHWKQVGDAERRTLNRLWRDKTTEGHKRLFMSLSLKAATERAAGIG